MESITKEHRVVMLPTNSRSDLYTTDQVVPFLGDKVTINYERGYGDTNYIVNSRRNQHLYFTSDDDIKEGDWMWRKGEQPTLVVPHFHWDFGVRYKKIIATTDPKLNREIEGAKGESVTDILPQIPQSFVESYVKNPVDKVELKYEMNGEYDGSYTNIWEQLKLHNNEVVVKEDRPTLLSEYMTGQKLYTKEEVETKLFELAEHYGRTSNRAEIDDFNEWCEENL